MTIFMIGKMNMNNNLYEWCLKNNKKNLIDEFNSNKNTNDISFFTYGTKDVII